MQYKKLRIITVSESNVHYINCFKVYILCCILCIRYSQAGVILSEVNKFPILWKNKYIKIIIIYLLQQIKISWYFWSCYHFFIIFWNAPMSEIYSYIYVGKNDGSLPSSKTENSFKGEECRIYYKHTKNIGKGIYTQNLNSPVPATVFQ